jgi:hypothetical protein
MKHMLPDPEANEQGDGYLTFYSCEFDDGKRVRNSDLIRLGEDGKICLMLCQSCLEQLNGQILRPLVLESLKGEVARTTLGVTFPGLIGSIVDERIAIAIRKIGDSNAP